MPERLFTVAQAAALIAAPNEQVAPVANQLRRLVQNGIIRTRGKSGTGRTAANTFAPCDLAAARICRSLIGLGIASDAVLREVEFAAYDLSGGTQGALDALRGYNGEHPPQVMFLLTMSEPDEAGERTMGAVIYEDRGDSVQHSSVAVAVTIAMTRWLRPLADLPAD